MQLPGRSVSPCVAVLPVLLLATQFSAERWARRNPLITVPVTLAVRTYTNTTIMGDEDRERSPLHEVGERLGMWENLADSRARFRPSRGRKSGGSSSSRGPLVGRHPVTVKVPPVTSGRRYGGMSETSLSPLTSRKTPCPPPTRPSKLPVVSVYSNPRQSLTPGPDTAKRKLTPPSCDEAVMSSGWSKPTRMAGISKRGERRGEVQARRRSPSLTRSRHNSPGGRPVRRNPSPSQLDPEQADALRRRLGAARTVKLYLLQQSGYSSFLVAGDSPQHYRVNIGPQTCSCGKGPGCLHILFIMLRVFKIPENDSRLTARELKEFEIDALMRSFEERKKSRVLRARQQSVEQPDSGGGTAEEDALCPICLEDMKENGERLRTCCHCHNNIHQHCMTRWMETPGEEVFCPLCRAPWSPLLKHSYHHFSPSPYQGQPKQRLSSLTSSGYSTISRTSDTLYMVEQGGCPEDIPLPRAEAIPQQHYRLAQPWITHYGRDLVGCLLSRDWVKREIGLRRLAREVVRLLQGGSSDKLERQWRCCAEMLATMIEDKVYKVYLAAVRALRALLNFLNCQVESQVVAVKQQVRPLVQSLLVKCADGNRRISEVSLETLCQLCRGQEGEFSLGRHSASASQGLELGMDFILPIILEDRDLQGVSWQWIMGRLVILDKILKELPQEFSLKQKNAGKNLDRLMRIIDFTFQNLASSHLNVCKISRKVFISAARLTAQEDITFRKVWGLLDTLDSTLQLRMRKKLTTAVEEFYMGDSKSFSTTSSIDEKSCSVQELDRRAFLEDFLSECSNKHTEPSQPIILGSSGSGRKWRAPLLRSSSHSPSRQLPSSRSSSQSPSRNLSKPHSVVNVFPSRRYHPHPTPYRQRQLASRGKPQYKCQELSSITSDILPKFDLSFLPDHKASQPAFQKDSLRQEAGSGVQSFRQPLRSPPSSRKWSQTRSPLSSPLLGREKKCSSSSSSCKDNLDYEESLALAMALSKSIYMETPLPVIPGLSHKSDVLAHPHRDMMEGGQSTREYCEGQDWTKATVLGTGAYSTCYQARDTQTGTIMAAKQISFCRNSDEEQDKVERLIREEVLLISGLQHPHVVRMYGAIQEGTHINVFVEWMAGGSISSLLDRHGVFSEVVIVRYLHQILLGLEYLHSNGILHRDLKGANLLVDNSGHHLRIADFGAAARMMSKSTVPGEFQGQLQGTIAFMAPEVLRGDSYGRSCDVWSLGCCLIEMATGKPPWGASDVSNHLALIFRIACAVGPPEVPSSVSPALRDLILRCLELDPALRPSARELLLHPVFQEV